MNSQSNSAPTEHEWALANVTVMQQGTPPIIGLKKELEKHGVVYSQTVWLTMTQLRAVAIDTTF